MASLVVAGDVSGSVTLSAPSAAGSTVITLPTTSGTMVVTGGAQTVQFAAGSAASPSITFTGDTNTGIFSPAADTIGFSEGGVESMRIDSSGNVGIGTSSPSYNLDVRRTSTGNVVRFTGSTDGGRGLAFTSADNGAFLGAIWDYNIASASGIHKWSIDSTERMRIDSSGNVSIGTTSAIAKLHINGNQYIDTYLGIGAAPTSNAMLYMSVSLNVPRDGIRIQTNQSPASGSFISFYNLSGNVAGSITHTGTTTVAYNTSSDYRLKENIAPMTGALAKVAALKPCTYTWKEDGTDGEGFIAHELAEVCPQAVTFEKDAVDDEGNPKYQGVDTSFLVATLAAAIQELNAKVEAQAAEIAALKGAN